MYRIPLSKVLAVVVTLGVSVGFNIFANTPASAETPSPAKSDKQVILEMNSAIGSCEKFLEGYFKIEEDLKKTFPAMPTLEKTGEELPSGKTEESIKDKFRNCVDEKFKPNPNPKPSPCQTEEKEFQTSYEKFIDACGELSPSAGTNCSKQMRNCSQCLETNAYDSTATEYSDLGCDADIDSEMTDVVGDILDSASETLQTSQIITTSGAGKTQMLKQRYKYCPAMAAEDLDSLKKEVREARKDIRELEVDLPKLQDEIDELKSEYNRKIQEIETDGKTASNEAEDEIKKIKNQMTNQKNETINAILEMEAQVAEIQQTINEAKMTQIKHHNDYQNELAKLDIGCHQQALDIVQTRREKVRAQIQSKQYTAGSLNSLFSSAGLSSRDQSKAMANKEFNRCRTDKKYSLAKASLKRSLDLGIKQIKQAIENLNAQLDEIAKAKQERLRRLTEDDQKMMMDELPIIQRNLTTKLENLQKKAENLQEEYSRLIKAKETELAQKNRQIAEERSYLTEKEAVLSAKKAYAPGGESTKVGSSMKALSTYNSAINRAKELINTCCTPCGTFGEEGTKDVSTKCVTAKQLLKPFLGADADKCELKSTYERKDGRGGGASGSTGP